MSKRFIARQAGYRLLALLAITVNRVLSAGKKVDSIRRD